MPAENGHTSVRWERADGHDRYLRVDGSPSVSPPASEIRHVEVDGLRLRVSVRGRGRALLIISGLGASLELAAPFVDEMCARGHQLISFDAPGVGGSTAYRW